MKKSFKSPFRSEKAVARYLADIEDSKPLSQREEVELSARIKQGDRGARDRLVKANLRFVVLVARLYEGQGLPLEDLIAEGNAGLIRAAEKFDGARGYKFITYAVRWIRQTIRKALIEQRGVIRLTLHQHQKLRQVSKAATGLTRKIGREPTLEEIVEDTGKEPSELEEIFLLRSKVFSLDAPRDPNDERTLLEMLEGTGPGPEEVTEDNLLKEEIRGLLDLLSPREAEVIRLYFGLEQERTLILEEIGERFGVTRERVRQIRDGALKKLRHSKRTIKLRAYCPR